MELHELKSLAERGFLTDVTAYEYFANNEEALKKLTGPDLVNMGLVTQISEGMRLALDSVYVSFKTIPENAALKVWGIPSIRKIVEVKRGTTIPYVVTADGYKELSGSVIADAAKEVQLTLEKEENVEMVDFTIDATPSEAVVTINDEKVKTKKVAKGSDVKWKVEAPNYTPQEGTETKLETNTTKTIILIPTNHKFTINATPKDAVVTINKEKVTTKDFPHGTSVEWSVTKEGFIEQKGTEVLNTDIVKDITLVAVESAPELEKGSKSKSSKK